MKTRTVITICVALLAVGIITSTAFSRGGGKHGKGEGLHLSSELMQQLSEEQVQTLKSLHMDLAKQILPLKAEVQVKHLELEQLWHADTLDEDEILAKTDEIFETEKQIRQTTTRHHLEAAKLLTKEQRTELMKSHRSGHDRHGKGRGIRGMRRHGDGDDHRRMRHPGREHHRKDKDTHGDPDHQ